MRRIPLCVSLGASATLALAVLTGCGSDSPSPAAAGSSGSSASAASSSAASPAPTDGKTLVQQATAALGAAASVHLSGSVQSDGETFDVDITYGPSIAQGTVDVGGGATLEMRKVTDGTVYAKGTAAYYAQAPGVGTGPDLSTIADHWVVVDDAAPAALSAVTGLLDKDGLVQSLEPDDENATYELSGPKDVDGTSAYLVTDKDGSVFAVAAEGDPLPLKITDDGEDGGELDFDGYGDDTTVDAPDPGEIVDIPS